MWPSVALIIPHEAPRGIPVSDMGKVYRGLFTIPRFDKPVYFLLQALRACHEATQWEILEAALVTYAAQPQRARLEALEAVRRAPSDQPPEYPITP